LLGDAAFCARILREFGVDDTAGFIINGHVPVKLEGRRGTGQARRAARSRSTGAFAGRVR